MTTAPPPRRPRGRPRVAGLDEKILEAARQVVAELGVAGASVTAIAERAGVGKPTVYLRWPNRLHVIEAAIEGTRADCTPETDSVLHLAAEAMHDLLDQPHGAFLAETLVMPRGVSFREWQAARQERAA